MPSLIVGSTPRGDDYFGQDDLIHTLWSRLVHDNVLLVAPRRFGKTGAMYRLLDDPHESFRPLYINVEHIMSAADFMVEFLATLLRHRHFSRYLDTLWESIKGMGHTVRDNTSSIDLGGLSLAVPPLPSFNITDPALRSIIPGRRARQPKPFWGSYPGQVVR